MHLRRSLAVNTILPFDFFYKVNVHILYLAVVTDLSILFKLFTDYKLLELSNAFVHRGHYLHFKSLYLLRASSDSCSLSSLFKFYQNFKRQTSVICLLCPISGGGLGGGAISLACRVTRGSSSSGLRICRSWRALLAS